MLLPLARITKQLIKLGLLLIICMNAQAASFDCAKAQSKIEHTICDNPEISTLDEELNAAYKTALQDEKQSESVKLEQKLWMKKRNKCADVACVKAAYRNRIGTLTGTPNMPTQTDEEKSTEQEFPQTPPKLRYAFCDRNNPTLYCEGQTGKGYSVCEAYLSYLKTLNSPPTCEAPVPPGFNQPDWEEMDVTQHLNLAYQAEGYFLKKFGGYMHPDFDAWRQIFLEEIQEGKINPRMRKTNVTPNGKGEAIILAYTRDRDACHKSYDTEEPQDMNDDRKLGMPANSVSSSQGNAGQLWVEQGELYFTLSDTTSDTLQVIIGDASWPRSDILLYSGRPYFVKIFREYSPLYKNREEQARARNGLLNAQSITWMDNSPITIYAFDPRFPDRRPNLDLNHYLVDKLCQFKPY